MSSSTLKFADTTATQLNEINVKKQTLRFQPIAEVESLPHERFQMSLGCFDPQNQPRGFSIEVLDAKPGQDDLITTSIVADESQGFYELILQIFNRSNNTVSIEVSQLAG